ncbi:MAG: WecB/TagA/CpsF family glycosyltransferase, partial [Lachnospiraceae bacterium]|nr:WecB/TagA/CpsF family glycosyltransferase [Lachnospiraceae bacterium]
EDEQIIKDINEANPDFIWVGLGAPKQEIWMAAHENKVNGLMIGVGAAFDYESGNIKRAPKWMQKLNLEWLYRLLQDPKRLLPRYVKTNSKFLIWKYKDGRK